MPLKVESAVIPEWPPRPATGWRLLAAACLSLGLFATLPALAQGGGGGGGGGGSW